MAVCSKTASPAQWRAQVFSKIAQEKRNLNERQANFSKWRALRPFTEKAWSTLPTNFQVMLQRWHRWRGKNLTYSSLQWDPVMHNVKVPASELQRSYGIDTDLNRRKHRNSHNPICVAVRALAVAGCLEPGNYMLHRPQRPILKVTLLGTPDVT